MLELVDRLRSFFSSMLDDLFNDGSGVEVKSRQQEHGLDENARIDAILMEAQSQLDQLRVEKQEAEVRRKQAQVEWDQEKYLAASLDQAVNQELQAGQEERARQSLEALKDCQAKVATLEQRLRSLEQVISRLEESITGLQERISETRTKHVELQERQRNLEALEQLSVLEREMRKASQNLEDELKRREEQIARKEDRLEARDEIARKSKQEYR